MTIFRSNYLKQNLHNIYRLRSLYTGQNMYPTTLNVLVYERKKSISCLKQKMKT